MAKTYCKTVCGFCGRITSSNGFATASHFKTHIKEGYFTQYMGVISRSALEFDIFTYQKENKGPKDCRFGYHETQT